MDQDERKLQAIARRLYSKQHLLTLEDARWLVDRCRTLQGLLMVAEERITKQERQADVIHHEVITKVTLLEKEIAKDDKMDQIGLVNEHLRVVWGFRDWVNEYFGELKGETKPEEVTDDE